MLCCSRGCPHDLCFSFWDMSTRGCWKIQRLKKILSFNLTKWGFVFNILSVDVCTFIPSLLKMKQPSMKLAKSVNFHCVDRFSVSSSKWWPPKSYQFGSVHWNQMELRQVIFSNLSCDILIALAIWFVISHLSSSCDEYDQCFLSGGSCKAFRHWAIFKTLLSLPKFSCLCCWWWCCCWYLCWLSLCLCCI